MGGPVLVTFTAAPGRVARELELVDNDTAMALERDLKVRTALLARSSGWRTLRRHVERGKKQFERHGVAHWHWWRRVCIGVAVATALLALMLMLRLTARIAADQLATPHAVSRDSRPELGDYIEVLQEIVENALSNIMSVPSTVTSELGKRKPPGDYLEVLQEIVDNALSNIMSVPSTVTSELGRFCQRSASEIHAADIRHCSLLGLRDRGTA